MTLKIEKIYDNPADSAGYECIATLSGGIDSTVVAHRLVHKDGYNPMFVYVQYGTKSQDAEIEAAKKTCERLGKSLYVIDFPLYTANNLESYLLGTAERDMDEPDATFWLEGRNANIVLTLATYAAMNEMWGVYIGINFSDAYGGHYPDTDYRFLTAMNSLLACSFKSRVVCYAPLLEDYLDKHEVIKEGIDTWGINWLTETHSCSSSEGYQRPCCDYENCPSCNSRKLDFEELGLPDPFSELVEK